MEIKRQNRLGRTGESAGAAEPRVRQRMPRFERMKLAAEVLIGAGSLSLAGVGVWFTATFQDAEAAREKTRIELQTETTQETFRLEDEQLRAAVLELWLPEFLGAEDTTRAEQMIVGLLPADAESVFEDLKAVYEQAGLLTPELAERLDDAIAGAERVASEQPQLALDFGTADTQGEAEELAQAAEDLGFSSVSIVGRGERFAVVVEVGTIDAAEALLPSAEEVSDEAVVADLRSDGAVIQVPNVFKATEAEGLALLRAAGFDNVVVWPVQSGSVAAGFVRQVVLDNGASVQNETVIVDVAGVRVDALDPETALAVKVSSGPG